MVLVPLLKCITIETMIDHYNFFLWKLTVEHISVLYKCVISIGVEIVVEDQK